MKTSYAKNCITLDSFYLNIYLFIYLQIFTQDCLFNTNQTVINESPAFVAKHLQQKPMAISSKRLSSPLWPVEDSNHWPAGYESSTLNSQPQLHKFPVCNLYIHPLYIMTKFWHLYMYGRVLENLNITDNYGCCPGSWKICWRNLHGRWIFSTFKFCMKFCHFDLHHRGDLHYPLK